MRENRHRMSVRACKRKVSTRYFSHQTKILRFFGLWPDRHSGPIGRIVYRAYQIVYLLPFTYAFTATEVVQLYFTWHDFDKFVSNLCYTFVHVMACSKISLFLLRMRDVQRITEIFENGIFDVRANKRCDDQFDIIEKCVCHTRRMLKVYFVIGGSVVLNSLLSPLYFSKKELQEMALKNASVSAGPYLPYHSYLPFDLEVSPNYEIAYAYQSVSMMTLSPIIVTTDVLYSSVLMHLAAQLQILQGFLRSIKRQPVKFVDENESKPVRDEMYDGLKKAILLHCAIIGLVQEIEKIFNVLILLQFISNLIVMCFPLFQILRMPILSFPFFSMVSLMSAMLFQLFIFCDCGDKVTRQSTLVAHAAYGSDWINGTLNFQRGICLIIARAQIPLELTVAKFAVLSRNAFLTVVKGSVSYFMFMSNASSED